MRHILLFLSLFFCTDLVGQTDTLTTPQDVPNKIGQMVKVKCRIERVSQKEGKKGLNTFLDQNKNWKENPFAIIVFSDKMESFPNLKDTYEGKTVVVSGIVTAYKKPNNTTQIQLVLNHPEQIQLAE
jgi:hypothetical protein